MNITFENILDKVVNNRCISRRDKLNEIRRFLKVYSGNNKPTDEGELEIIEKLKAVRKTYTMQDANEKLKDRMVRG